MLPINTGGIEANPWGGLHNYIHWVDPTNQIIMMMWINLVLKNNVSYFE
jgi:hypothetical protein